MQHLELPLASKRYISATYFELEFELSKTGEVPRPGMFFTAKINGVYGPTLRRPFAFSGFDTATGKARAVIEKRGPGTVWLSSLEVGDRLDFLGPLGNAFSVPERGVRPILAAGGIGLGPMLFFAEELARKNAAGACEAPILVAGFRSADLVPSVDFPAGTIIATDDGSLGVRGTILDAIMNLSESIPRTLYACGPSPMLAALARYAASLSIRYEASVEQWMACGVGACMGCVVPMMDGAYKRACADGPVFDGLAVNWEDLA